MTLLAAAAIVAVAAETVGHFLRPAEFRLQRKMNARAMGLRGRVFFTLSHVLPCLFWLAVLLVVGAGIQAFGYRANEHGWYFVLALAGFLFGGSMILTGVFALLGGRRNVQPDPR